jgi:transcriptional regulator with XRE-family HTH domain
MIKKQLGEFVRSERVKQNLSQQAFSDKIKRRRQAAREVENDLVDYRFSVLVDMLGALGFELTVTPIKKVGFDFSKVEPAKPDQIIGPFKKQIKKHEKNHRRPRS